MKVNETTLAGLGNNSVPDGYNQPDFGVGTATQSSFPNPDAQLAAASAARTPNGIDPLNKGYQLGGAYDPLAEFEPAQDNPTGLSIGGGKPPTPISSPHFPPMASTSFKEDDFNEEDFLGNEAEGLFAEGDPFEEYDADQSFESVDAIPAFEDISDDPALAALPVDADSVIQPIVIPDDEIIDPELGEIPDVILPFEEPILDITEDDVDVAIPENVFENDGMPEAIPVVESFKLPENQKIVISKGDQIFLLGHMREEFAPKFAECVFYRAVKSLAESKGQSGGTFFKVGLRHEKVAVIGRSVLVEVAKDWKLPGTSIIFEAKDLLQIVSAKPVQEAEESNKAEDDKDKDDKSTGKSEKSKKKEDEVEKAKKEALMAYRRWKEASKKRKEDEGEDEDDLDEDDDDSGDDADKAEKKAKKERAKREAAMLKRQRMGGWI